MKKRLYLLSTILSAMAVLSSPLTAFAAEESSGAEATVGNAINCANKVEEVSEGCYTREDSWKKIIAMGAPMDEGFAFHVTDSPLDFDVPRLLNGYMWYDIGEDGKEFPVYCNGSYVTYDDTLFEGYKEEKKAVEYLKNRVNEVNAYGAANNCGEMPGGVDGYYGIHFNLVCISNDSFEFSRTIEGDTIELDEICVFGPLLQDYGPIKTSVSDWKTAHIPLFTNVEFEDPVVKRGFQVMKFKATASWGTTYDMELPVVGYPKPMSRADSADPVPVPTYPEPEEPESEPEQIEEIEETDVDTPEENIETETTENEPEEPAVIPADNNDDGNDGNTEDVKADDEGDKQPDKATDSARRSALKAEISVIVAAVLSLGVVVAGVINGWWMLLLNLLFVGTRKKWHGILTLDKNLFIKLKADSNVEAEALVSVIMKDISEQHLSAETYIREVCANGTYTYLPSGTKMTLSYTLGDDIVCDEMDANEKLLFERLRSLAGTGVTMNILLKHRLAGVHLEYNITVY